MNKKNLRCILPICVMGSTIILFPVELKIFHLYPFQRTMESNSAKIIFNVSGIENNSDIGLHYHINNKTSKIAM